MRILAIAVAIAATVQPAWATFGIPVPEPTSLALLGMAAAGVVAAFRVGRRK